LSLRHEFYGLLDGATSCLDLLEFCRPHLDKRFSAGSCRIAAGIGAVMGRRLVCPQVNYKLVRRSTTWASHGNKSSHYWGKQRLVLRSFGTSIWLVGRKATWWL